MAGLLAPEIAAEPKPMGEFSRLQGVFFEPGRTFADIAQRPRWIVPLLIGILFSLGYIYAFSQHIGWETYMHRIMDNNQDLRKDIKKIKVSHRHNGRHMTVAHKHSSHVKAAKVSKPVTHANMGKVQKHVTHEVKSNKVIAN